MKLKLGEVIHVGKEKFTDFIPDDKAKKIGLLKDKPKKEKAVNESTISA